MTICAIEMKYKLKKSPITILTKSWHHQSDKMAHEGNYADVDITDPLFPRLPTYKSFYDNECLGLVYSIFHQDFKIYKYPSVFEGESKKMSRTKIRLFLYIIKYEAYSY